MWSEKETFEKGKYREKYQRTGFWSKQSSTGAELNQARSRQEIPRVDVPKQFCFSRWNMNCTGKSRCGRLLLARLWRSVLFTPEHAIKELVQHVDRAAHFLATALNQFLRHLHLFPSFSDVEAEIPLLTLLPQLPGLATSHVVFCRCL